MKMNPSRIIRPATTADIPDIMPVFDEARQKAALPIVAKSVCPQAERRAYINSYCRIATFSAFSSLQIVSRERFSSPFRSRETY